MFYVFLRMFSRRCWGADGVVVAVYHNIFRALPSYLIIAAGTDTEIARSGVENHALCDARRGLETLPFRVGAPDQDMQHSVA